MKPRYILHILAVLFLLAQTGYAASNNQEANFNKIKESWELSADGSQIYRYRKELKIFTHTAMNNTYGETFITYNPRCQKLKINESYTIQTDGSIVKHPQNAFVEVLPENAAKMPAYNHLKEMVVVHTGLELGATIVLDYTIESAAGYLPEIDICKPLLETSPITDYEMQFAFPKAKAPHYQLMAQQAEPAKSVQDDKQILTFRFQHLPAMPRDVESHIENGDIPAIAFSSYTKNEKALNRIFMQFDSAKELKELTQQVIGDKKNNAEKMETIHQYVISNIVVSPLSFNVTGFRFRPAKEVIASAYATEMEKVNILYGMLKAAGLNATPLAAYNLDVNENVLGLNAVNKWLIKVTDKGNTYYLDALSTNHAAATSAFMVALNNGKKELTSEKNHRIAYTADINFTEGKPVATVSANFSKDMLPNYGVSSSKFLSLNESKDSDKNTGSFKGTSAVDYQKIGNIHILTLPETSADANHKKYASYNKERLTNLMLPCLFNETYEYKIHLPQGITFHSKEVSKDISKSCGNVSIQIKKEGNSVVVKRSLDIHKRLITPEEYADFIKMMAEWNDPHMRQIILK